MLLCSKEWVRELNSSCITRLQSDSYNCPQLSLVLLEFPLHCIPDYCFIIAYVWYPFQVCCHFSLMPRLLVQIKGYPITQRADRPRKWKSMLRKVCGAEKGQLISTVKMYSLPTCQIMTHVAHHMSHICWEGNLATLYGLIRSFDDQSLRNSPPGVTSFENSDALMFENSARKPPQTHHCRLRYYSYLMWAT